MRVSVIIAAFNVEALIGRAIDSVQAQTIDDWEIVVVDDASRDGTAELVSCLAGADPRIRLLRQNENQGPSAARNRAIEAARGEWLAILDADDAWLPERLESLLALTESGADIIADDLILYDEGLGRDVGLAFGFNDDIIEVDIEGLFARDNPFSLSLIKPLLRRRFLIDNGFRYDENLRSAEDFLFYAEMLFEGARVILTRRAFYVYTMRRGPVSRQWSSGSRSTTLVGDLTRIADTLLLRYGDRVTPGIAAGIARFRRMTEGRRTSGEITRLRQEHDFGGLALFLLLNPRGAFRYLVNSRTWKRTFRRDTQNA